MVRGGDTWYELAHDRLVEPIRESNRAWQTAYHNPLAGATQAWLASGRDPRRLLRGELLEDAQRFVQSRPGKSTDGELAFLTESKRQAQQATRRRRLLTTATATVITAVSLLAFFAWQQAQSASSNALVAAAVSTLQIDPERSILLATEAIDIHATNQAEEALHHAVARDAHRARLAVTPPKLTT